MIMFLQIAILACLILYGEWNHILVTDFSIANKTCFSMSTAVYYHDASSSCTVTCINSSRMDLSFIDTVLVSGLSFMKCGGNIARNVDRFILKNSNFTMDPHSAYMYRGRAWSVFGSEILSIDNCIFTNNSASHRAGALYVSAVMNATITACTFNNNTAGGGGVRGGVAYISATNSIIDGSTFLKNSVQGGGAKGGALYIDATNSIINGNEFINNAAYGGSAKGGALYVDAVKSVINSSMFEFNMVYGGAAKGGALYANAMESVINSSTFERNRANGGGAEGGALYVRAANSIIGISTFINNTATHGVPWYIIASSSIISHDATYEGIELYHTYNIMTLTDGICGQFPGPVNCQPPQPPINGTVKYNTTQEGSLSVYKCDNGFLPYGEFKTKCCETGQWFPDPMELTCIEEPFNCTILPSISINGVLLNLTSTSAVIGCAADDNLTTVPVTITCMSQDVWSHLHPTDLIECSLPVETTRKGGSGTLILATTTTTLRKGSSGTLILAMTTITSVFISCSVLIMVIIFCIWAVIFKKKHKGNGDDRSVGTSTTPGPYYEEILPSYYNQVSNENLKRNQLQEDLELQENTAYQIKGTSTTPGPYYEEILPSYYNQVSNENLKCNQLQEDLELQENTAYQITTLNSREIELHENAAYCSVKVY